MIWLYEGCLQIAYREALLAQYAYRWTANSTSSAIEQPQLYHTPFTDPQLGLWELDDEQWRKVLERPLKPRRRKGLERRSSIP